jgi:hypothetical protein
MSQIKEWMIDGAAQIVASTSRTPSGLRGRRFEKVDLDQVFQPRDELLFDIGSGGVMHFSDVILQSSRQALRLAAECTDENVAVELHVLAVKLWLAVVKDTELIVEEIPVFADHASGSRCYSQESPER